MSACRATPRRSITAIGGVRSGWPCKRLVDSDREQVNGTARLELYKGNLTLLGRRSERHSLYRPELATFEEGGDYQQADAEGFLRITALRLRHGRKPA